MTQLFRAAPDQEPNPVLFGFPSDLMAPSYYYLGILGTCLPFCLLSSFLFLLNILLNTIFVMVIKLIFYSMLFFSNTGQFREGILYYRYAYFD